MSSARAVSVSIVSHGQGRLVERLLADLRKLQDVLLEIIITFNVPEDTRFLSNFRDLPIEVISNSRRRGFGANHNAAFVRSAGEVFIVANPDIRAETLTLEPLLHTLDAPAVGACAPLVVSSTGAAEDSARRFPTFTRLLIRVTSRERRLEYAVSSDPVVVDWVAGMFMAFKRDSFERVNGFDERFFMYFEDADICRRLKHLKLLVILDPRSRVIHDAQRASHRRMDHLRWHLRSAMRYLTGI